MTPMLRGIIIVLLTCSTLPAWTAPSFPFNPQDGETVVFLGDSITHQSLYPQYLENFFITRHPERRIRFRNSGVGGDAAADANARFEEEVAVHQPDYVTIHLGMNDGRYQEFNTNNLALYQAGMSKLLDRIETIGAKAILLSPTMFDHQVVRMRIDDEAWRFRGKEFSSHYNALLGYFTGWGMETASRRGIPFVNWWAPLNRHTTGRRRTDPEFNLIWDAIHPNPSGQVIMACEFLLQLGVERKAASAVTIRKQGAGWAGSGGVTRLEVSGDADEIRFSHRAVSIPWIVPEKHSELPLKWKLPPDGRRGYTIANAGPMLSADRLQVTGLPPGNYRISIDGQYIGTWNHVTLGTMIELQENEKTPQFRQALRVARLNRRRHDEYIRPARDLAGRIKGLRRKGTEKNHDRIRELYDRISELTIQADQAWEEIHEAAQPVEREWVIRNILR